MIMDTGMIMDTILTTDTAIATVMVTAMAMKGMTTATESGISAESQVHQGQRFCQTHTSLPSKHLNCRSLPDMEVLLTSLMLHLQVVLNCLMWSRSLDRPLVHLTSKMIS